MKKPITPATRLVQESTALPFIALRSVTSKRGMGVFASSDTLYRGAVFGRDSLVVAEDLMGIKPQLVKDILLALSRLQGHEYNLEREEEPGKIVHEYRSMKVNGKPIRGSSLEIFRSLSEKWGGSDAEMAYYGSIDATPHYLRTLGTYCELYGDKFLDKKVRQRNGDVVSIRDVADDAATWLFQKLETSRSGLLEFQRVNPLGIVNQVWKDSDEFYVHENGTVANHDAPIASIEVQGLAYDALLAAARFFPDHADEYVDRAYELRDRTLELLWDKDRHRFSLGTDFDADDNIRVITTATANPGSLLNSGFFDKLPAKSRHTYLGALVAGIMSSDFLTDAGIRSRALSASSTVTYWDYHGSFVCWPKEAYDIAKGLRRQGFPALSRQIENRLLNIFLKSRSYPEFVFVDNFGRVLASKPTRNKHAEITTIFSSDNPERIQAWTVSAIIAIISRRTSSRLKLKRKMIHGEWQKNLERDILGRIPNVGRYLNPFALQARYPTYQYRLGGKKSPKE